MSFADRRGDAGDEQLFAFGRTELKPDEEDSECIDCPAMTFGVEPNVTMEEESDENEITGIATLYDNRLREKYNSSTGIVPESEARKAWLRALVNGPDESTVTERGQELGLEIAREFDWLEDDETPEEALDRHTESNDE